jgi:hypothetical protein
MPHWSTLTSTPANLLRRDDGTQNIWRATHNDDTRDAPLSDAPFPAIGEALFPWHARCTHPFQCPRQLWSWWVQETLRHFTSPFASWRTCKTRQDPIDQQFNNCCAPDSSAARAQLLSCCHARLQEAGLYEKCSGWGSGSVIFAIVTRSFFRVFISYF